ncbi:Crp/Fnr family transcriptional regulator [Cryomorphaceae bacterium 1068]|nr:Crp/Fnr family transcriptional regulator [Cryomorphaceae bacterium 1068]
MITTENLFAARFDQLEPALKEEILATATEKEVEAGTTLLKAGSTINSTMLVLDGRLKVYREDSEGHEFLIYFLESGSACAMSIMCAAMDEKSQITVVAETDVTLLSIPFDSTRKWLNGYPSWDEFILRTYRSKMDELLQVLDNIAFRSMDERLVFYLKRMTEGRSNVLRISHQEVARDLNSAREVISRLLKKLEQRGVVELHRNEIRVINLDFVSAV